MRNNFRTLGCMVLEKNWNEEKTEWPWMIQFLTSKISTKYSLILQILCLGEQELQETPGSPLQEHWERGQGEQEDLYTLPSPRLVINFRLANRYCIGGCNRYCALYSIHFTVLHIHHWVSCRRVYNLYHKRYIYCLLPTPILWKIYFLK